MPSLGMFLQLCGTGAGNTVTREGRGEAGERQPRVPCFLPSPPFPPMRLVNRRYQSFLKKSLNGVGAVLLLR